MKTTYRVIDTLGTLLAIAVMVALAVIFKDNKPVANQAVYELGVCEHQDTRK